jgi:hypothetical protein
LLPPTSENALFAKFTREHQKRGVRIPLEGESGRRQLMARIVELVGWAFFAVVIVWALVFVAVTWGGQKAVSCVDDRFAAMSVQVTTDRRGHIAERYALGCTFYSYAPPQDPQGYARD